MPIPLIAPFAIVAQVPVLSAPVEFSSRQQSPTMSSLVEALPSLAWRAETQGVLLVVGPESIQVPDFQKRAMRGDWPKVPPPGATAANVAALFDYGVEKVGSLFVFVPKKVKHFLGAPDAPPDSAEPMEDYEVARELSRSLTAGQWKRMASEEGLGIDGMTPVQQKLYLQILPDPIRLRPQGGDVTLSQEPIELTPEQRKQVRVVMDRNLSVNFVGDGATQQFFGFGEMPSQARRRFYLESYSNERNRATDMVAPLVANKLKPGDLNFASRTLDERVSLKDVKTVGELMGRIREATGQSSILADARLHGRSVKVWGDEARSGDVLKALCRAFGGTFRKVGEGDEALYVLTDDRVGIGTRMAAYQSWRNLGSMLRSGKQQEELDKSAASLDFQSLTALDDPWGLPEGTLADVQKRNRVTGPDTKWEDRLMSVGALPASLQKYVQDQVKQNPSITTNDGTGERKVSIRSDKVSLQSSYRVQILVPNVGKADAWQLSSLTSGPQLAEFRRNPPKPEEKPAEPLRFPDKWKERAILARPTTAAECAALAKAAKENGFGALWLDLPPDLTRARKLLADAIAAGKSEGISIGAQVSVFRTTVPDAPLDVTILGEPSDAEGERVARALSTVNSPFAFRMNPNARQPGVYLEPNQATYAALTRELTLLARTPGLSTLVLTALTPPGYARFTPTYYGGSSIDLGYTLANRLAFLRQESVDPVDLGRNYDSQLVPEVFQDNGANYIDLGNGQYGPDPKYRNRNQLWSELRAKNVEGLTVPLYTKLREAAPNLRLFVAPSDDTFGNGGYFGEWQKPDARETVNAAPWDDSQKIARARSFSPYILNQLPSFNFSLVKDEKQREEFRRSMRMYLQRQTKLFGPAGLTWNGFVADFSLTPAVEISSALGQFKEDPK